MHSTRSTHSGRSSFREELLWALVFLPLPALIVFIAAVDGGQRLNLFD